MNNVKPWYQNAGVWGALVSLIALIVSAFGYELSSADQQTLVQILIGAAGGIGSLVALVEHVKISKVSKVIPAPSKPDNSSQ